MKDSSREKPEILVSRSETADRDDDFYYSEADFLLVGVSDVQLWVDGVHFVEDPDGAVQEGQYFIVRDPGLGVMVSVIESVNLEGSSAKVRHVYHWHRGDLEFPDSIEEWNTDEITGNHDRTMGDASSSTFIRKES